MKIADTGYWESDKKLYHVCCTALCDWVATYLSNQKDKLIYDFGCGLGKYCDRLQQAGFQKLIGFEGTIPVEKEFDNIRQQDLSVPFVLSEKGNVIFFEVAEHVPAQFEDIMITNVTDACNDNFIMSWAIRGQGGTGHVNCLNNDEVITRIINKGFIYLPDETADARSKILDNDPCPWFKNTTLIFKKK